MNDEQDQNNEPMEPKINSLRLNFVDFSKP